MSISVRTTTRYRDYSVQMNPSGMLCDAKKDTFYISKIGVPPHDDVLLYEHPRTQVKDYPTESSARAAALIIAKLWIDKRIE